MFSEEIMHDEHTKFFPVLPNLSSYMLSIAVEHKLNEVVVLRFDCSELTDDC